MGDPLSVIASVIAVFGAVESISRSLNKIRESSKEVLALIDEVSDLKDVVYAIERRLRDQPAVFDAEITDQYSHLSALMNRAKELILVLDRRIEYQLTKPEPMGNRPKVSKLEWLRVKPHVERVRQDLRDIRHNIQSHMAVINL